MPSNMRTYVQWKDSSVFAGEEIECIITFRNVARTAQQRERDAIEGRHGSRGDILRPILERQRTVTQSTAFTKPSLARLPSIASSPVVPAGRGHRANPSMSVAPNSSQTGLSSNASAGQRRPGKGHERSLSILSLGTDTIDSPPRRSAGLSTSRGPHNRSSSLQMTPRTQQRNGVQHERDPGSNDHTPAIVTEAREARESAHQEEVATPPLNGSETITIGRRRSGANITPATPAMDQIRRSRSGTISADYRFPTPEIVPEDAELDFSSPNGKPTHARQSSGTQRRLNQISPPVSPGDTGPQGAMLNPMARVLSEASVDGTPRNSSDLYSMSNVSDETVNSEMPFQQHTKSLTRQSLSRSDSRRGVPSRSDEPEHLMMGYAQVKGSFSLDGSLVNQAPFEEVKRKGIVSSQGGGGVVGVEQSKRQSGLFRGFGWSNIGEGLTGLLGMDEQSSLREMRSIISSKTVPMLSTPQSILFVDLRLAPGQSRSYSYRFTVPKGLPPSHKGRAIKITYHLRVAVQRAGSLDNQKIKDVEIPFRVLGSVNRHGEVLGHDLMNPYILLQDPARTSAVAEDEDLTAFFANHVSSKPKTTPAAGMDDFLRYTERLLFNQPEGGPLMSPTPTIEKRFSTDVLHAKTMQERIDLAILRANQTSSHSSADAPVQSLNRFTIARAGRHIGVLTILRPFFRLGEEVLVQIDLVPPTSQEKGAASLTDGGAQPTYLVSLSLETTERVDPSLALRSAASVQRVTRKIHASSVETVLFASRIAFRLEIPTSATPTFETTRVRLDWRIRVEFIVGAQDAVYLPSVAPVKRTGFESEEDEADDLVEKTAGLGISDAETGGTDKERRHDEVQNVRTSGDTEARPDDDWLTADGLLENVSEDERGRILVARQKLSAEMFEVNVPIKVFGVAGAEGGGGAGISEVMEI